MENEEKKCEEGCKEKCGGCRGMTFMSAHGCHGGKCHHLIKIILMLVIVMMIFCFGFKLGSITGSIREGRYEHSRSFNKGGYGMMRGYGYGNLYDVQIENKGNQNPAQNPTPAPIKNNSAKT
jgi:hypothetical protein